MSTQTVTLVNKSKYTLVLHGARDPEKPAVATCEPLTLERISRTEGIPKEQWDLLEKHEGTQRYIKKGFLIVVKGRPKGKGASLSGENVRDAHERIEMSTDIEELQEMLATETRDDVKLAIEKRLLAVAKG